MARYTFRTLLNDQPYGVGFFEYTDICPNPWDASKEAVFVEKPKLTAFGYKDPEVGDFGLGDLREFRFSLTVIPALSQLSHFFFGFIVHTPRGQEYFGAGNTHPGQLGTVTGKAIKLEWPTLATAAPVQDPSQLPGNVPSYQTTDQPHKYAMGLLLPEQPLTVEKADTNPPANVIPVPVPSPYDGCIKEWFAQMGRETRCFVLETIEAEIANLINNSNIDVSRLTLVLNEIRDALDGDAGTQGLQAYVKLVNDIKFLMDNRLTQQDIVNIINNTKVGDNNINAFVNNSVFINGVINNQQIAATFVNNTTAKIISYLTNDASADADIRNQLIAALSQLIIRQITQVKQEINNSVNFMREDINNKIQQINIEVANVNNILKGNSNAYVNKLELNNLQIQIDSLKEKINSANSLEFNVNIDLSRNVTIVNIFTQISQINSTIAGIKADLRQYMTRNDFAYACETACNAFLNALYDPTPCEKMPPKPPPKKEPSTPKLPPIKVRPGAEIKGDPHFIGAEGDQYDVQGEVGKTYNLLSDQDLQVNGTFGEWNVDGQGTIIKEIGITHGQDFIKIGLQGALEINDKPVTSDGVHLNGVVTKAGNDITFKSEEYELLITDNQVQGHHYLNIGFKSDNVVADGVLPHGLWGQTADGDGKVREGDKGHAAQGGGAIEDASGNITQAGNKEAIKAYEVNGLRDTSFGTHNKFAATAS